MRNNQRKQRDSNLELLRIFCMIAIIAFHCIQHSGDNDFSLLSNGAISINLIYSILIGIWGSIATLTFIAISSYYMVDTGRIHWKKILMVQVQCWGLGLISVCGALLLGQKISLSQIVRIIATPVYPQYSFITTWIVFYLSVPVMQFVIKNLSTEKLKKVVLVFTFLVPVYNIIWNNVGSHLLSFYYMFFLIAVVKSDKTWNVFMEEKCKTIFHVGIGVLFITVLGSRLLGDYLEIDLFTVIGMRLYRNYNIFLYALAIALVYIFKEIEIGHLKWVNFAASGTLGIYILHESIIFRTGDSLLWNYIFNVEGWFGESTYILYVTMAVLMVYIGCMLVSLLFSWILEKTLFNKKMCEKFCNKIDELINYETEE